MAWHIIDKTRDRQIKEQFRIQRQISQGENTRESHVSTAARGQPQGSSVESDDVTKLFASNNTRGQPLRKMQDSCLDVSLEASYTDSILTQNEFEDEIFKAVEKDNKRKLKSSSQSNGIHQTFVEDESKNASSRPKHGHSSREQSLKYSSKDMHRSNGQTRSWLETQDLDDDLTHMKLVVDLPETQGSIRETETRGSTRSNKFSGKTYEEMFPKVRTNKSLPTNMLCTGTVY